MNYFTYCTEYKKFLDKWERVKRRNEGGDYTYGFAGYGPGCDKTIFFDNDEQKNNYRMAYGF